MNNKPKSYWVPPGLELTLDELRLSPDGLDEADRKKVMEKVGAYIKMRRENLVGFQATQNEDFQDLREYMTASVNNIGDPFSTPPNDEPSPTDAPPDGYFQVNSKYLERAVLDYYAKLWNAKSPHLTKDDTDNREEWLESYWGYVLSMGSTEANLLALRNARDYLNGTRLQFDNEGANTFLQEMGNDVSYLAEMALRYISYQSPIEVDKDAETTPVLFYTAAAHYSIKKIAKILHIKTFQDIGNRYFPNRCPITEDKKWPATVPTNPDATINLDALATLVDFFAREGYPIIVNFNFGTTWTGAYDDVGAGCSRLMPILKQHGMDERVVKWDGEIQTRKGFWFHVDGALGAGYVPFLKMDEKNGGNEFNFPEFDFKLDIQSISMSGHKWMGAPWPCGIFMTKNKYLITNDVPAYVGSLDSTLAGSRNGFSAILFWDYISKRSYADHIKDAKHSQELAGYVYDELVKIYPAEEVQRAPGSLAVRFPRPGAKIVDKYSLSSMGKRSHIFLMKNVAKSKIDELLSELRAEKSALKARSYDGAPLEEILQQGW